MKRTRESEAAQLEKRGFDGLYYPGPEVACGCFIGDLWPCGDRPKECRGGHTRDMGDGEVIGIFAPIRKRRSLPSSAPDQETRK